MQDFEGKIAVVTGAASGIGEGMARTFASEGMHVVVSDIEAAAAEEVSKSLREIGVRSIAVETDVSDRASVEALAVATYTEFGAAHLVCNNAGVCLGSPAHESTDDDWRWLFSVNVEGVINGCQSFIPRLIEQGPGSHIVNTASIAGFLPFGQTLGAYSASKAAVVGISESYADSIQPYGIGMSILCPGLVTTNLISAERNRPTALGERPGNLEPILGDSHQEEGMDPMTVGKWVVQALRDDQRFIFSHPEMREFVQDHFDHVMAGFDWAQKQDV